MAQLEHNKSLKAYNTFGIEASGRLFSVIQKSEDLLQILNDGEINSMSRLILGGGSNILFTGNFDGIVIKNEIRGIEILENSDVAVLLKIMSGEVWHDAVMFAVNNGFGGIENLSLIPGTAGAAPMQNIGAYGVELEKVFESLEAINLASGEIEVFSKKQCYFGYRESVFKHDLKGKYFILSITLRLTKNAEVHTEYGAIKEILEAKGIDHPQIKDVSDAVIEIRRSKLPNPAELGNAGSFFKNPKIEVSHFEQLKTSYPTIPGYHVPSGKIKVPAGWMIEQCGWKGLRMGHTGSHARQALVLVNYGDATGQEILQLAREIQASVREKFGIDINPEVNIVP